MNVDYGNGKTEYGPGVQINLTATDVARAIYAYLVAHDVNVNGPRTIRINGELIEYGKVYVDPSGCVMVNGTLYNGNGKK